MCSFYMKRFPLPLTLSTTLFLHFSFLIIVVIVVVCCLVGVLAQAPGLARSVGTPRRGRALRFQGATVLPRAGHGPLPAGGSHLTDLKSECFL
jgi:hypothetical protein